MKEHRQEEEESRRIQRIRDEDWAAQQDTQVELPEVAW